MKKAPNKVQSYYQVIVYMDSTLEDVASKLSFTSYSKALNRYNTELMRQVNPVVELLSVVEIQKDKNKSESIYNSLANNF